MNIRGRVDVYCTESDDTFIAVASSTELNDFGQPTVVRIVEFMATDPLHKATRISDFGEFEFRATELHDEIMTLAQVQQLWNEGFYSAPNRSSSTTADLFDLSNPVSLGPYRGSDPPIERFRRT